MINNSIRNKIKRIKIYTKRVMHSALSGDYLSAFKGAGLEFDQIREYQMGDDIRMIDWNSSAKMNKIMVKQYREERDRTVILAIDISSSTEYSSQEEQRYELIQQLSASLAYLASEGKDKVGAVFFSDHIEKWIPPSRGSAHNSRILETIFSQSTDNKKTDIAGALKFLIKQKQRNAVLFFISDWIDSNPSIPKLLRVAGCEYDFISIRLLDLCEKQLPSFGMLDIQDPETGAIYSLSCRQSSSQGINQLLLKRANDQKRLFNKCKIDSLDLIVGHSFINPLLSFFRQRTRRQI